MTLEVLDSVAAWNTWRARHPGVLAFVPTMGALHEGHLSLVRRARELADLVVVSIFVNPTQFGAGEDFDRYPRTLNADLAALGDLADVVFAPSVEEVYPPDTTIDAIAAGPEGDTFEGAVRPGHFDGMLTVVNRLFDIVDPDIAVFGAKDAQQVFLVRRLATHRGRPLIDVAPVSRESDGLARSSRNRYLSDAERAAATVMPATLREVANSVGEGVPSARAHGIAAVACEPLAKLDYLEFVDPATFRAVPDTFHGEATLVLAAHIGATRLLDTQNVIIP